MTTTCTVTQNWECDGMLDIHNDQTLKTYQAIRNEQYHHIHPETCWEFSNIKNVIAKLKPLLNEGEKIIQFANGGFATPKGLEMMKAYWKSIDDRIRKECDPQEVYYYEYNNHESCINYDGDTEAINIINDIWGEEIARKIKRFNRKMTIDQLLLKDIEIGTLFFNDDQTPNDIWFSEKDGKAYTMYNSTLYPVYDGDNHQFKAQSQHWWGMSARYDKNKLHDWHKE